MTACGEYLDSHQDDPNLPELLGKLERIQDNFDRDFRILLETFAGADPVDVALLASEALACEVAE